MSQYLDFKWLRVQEVISNLFWDWDENFYFQVLCQVFPTLTFFKVAFFLMQHSSPLATDSTQKNDPKMAEMGPSLEGCTISVIVGTYFPMRWDFSLPAWLGYWTTFRNKNEHASREIVVVEIFTVWHNGVSGLLQRVILDTCRIETYDQHDEETWSDAKSKIKRNQDHNFWLECHTDLWSTTLGCIFRSVRTS